MTIFEITTSIKKPTDVVLSTLLNTDTLVIFFIKKTFNVIHKYLWKTL